MRTFTPVRPEISATITSQADRLPVVLWTAAVALLTVAAFARPAALVPAAGSTLGPFLTLAAIIAGSVLAGRLGLFRLLARELIRDRAPRPVAAASVLVFTAVLAGLVNLDVAAVVAMPVAIAAAERHDLPADRLAVAAAVTANATSFLLPTANITTLLLLGHMQLLPLAYLRSSWVAWLLVVTTTVAAMTGWLAGAGPGPVRAARPATPGRGVPSARAALDLIPLYVGASSIRAILAAGVTLRGGLLAQFGAGTVLTCLVNNLPAAAALRPAGAAGLWAAILATAMGPGLLITGSVATVICRRIARESGTTLRAWQFSLVGAALIPAQLAVAVIGLHLTGALR
jgi:Na+/H+ antiporter NhaD/arsenite permease-like protein